MTREETKALLPAIQHFADGGTLWKWTGVYWQKMSNEFITFNEDREDYYIIEDKHFEARKADALGEEVQYSDEMLGWVDIEKPEWLNDHEYRPKPKKVYEWQYIFPECGKYSMTARYYTDAEVISSWTKFEPSKRMRKCRN